ncbi:MAG: hypothetical protein ACI9MR_000647 [Myxococcota bacterium]|jgi:hypothetical protein
MPTPPQVFDTELPMGRIALALALLTAGPFATGCGASQPATPGLSIYAPKRVPQLPQSKHPDHLTISAEIEGVLRESHGAYETLAVSVTSESWNVSRTNRYGTPPHRSVQALVLTRPPDEVQCHLVYMEVSQDYAGHGNAYQRDITIRVYGVEKGVRCYE